MSLLLGPQVDEFIQWGCLKV